MLLRVALGVTFLTADRPLRSLGTAGDQQRVMGELRSVPLSVFALEWLNRLVRFIDIPEVFVNPSTGKPWKAPREKFEKARRIAKVDWVGFHGLRHFRATQWLMHGVDVTVVKELLGHSSIQTTMRYLHYVQSQARRSVIEAQEREAQDEHHPPGPVEDNWRITGGHPSERQIGSLQVWS